MMLVTLIFVAAEESQMLTMCPQRLETAHLPFLLHARFLAVLFHALRLRLRSQRPPGPSTGLDSTQQKGTVFASWSCVGTALGSLLRRLGGLLERLGSIARRLGALLD
eukprot:7508608-Pyramimonas_sp.AAC.1